MSTSSRFRDDGGVAVVEFTMVAAFVLIPLFLGIVQLAFVLHARNIVVASAAVGARYRASPDSNENDGAREACRRIKASLPGVKKTLTCTEKKVNGGNAGNRVQLVEVRVEGPVPMFFLPWGSVNLSVTGHAVDESAIG
ncbi:MAG: TadE family protein [Mycobacteriales bacterium]